MSLTFLYLYLLRIFMIKECVCVWGGGRTHLMVCKEIASARIRCFNMGKNHTLMLGTPVSEATEQGQNKDPLLMGEPQTTRLIRTGRSKVATVMLRLQLYTTGMAFIRLLYYVEWPRHTQRPHSTLKMHRSLRAAVKGLTTHGVMEATN